MELSVWIVVMSSVANTTMKVLRLRVFPSSSAIVEFHVTFQSPTKIRSDVMASRQSLPSFIIRLEYWIHFGGVTYAFGYNSAEREPIWMKSGAL